MGNEEKTVQQLLNLFGRNSIKSFFGGLATVFRVARQRQFKLAGKYLWDTVRSLGYAEPVLIVAVTNFVLTFTQDWGQPYATWVSVGLVLLRQAVTSPATTKNLKQIANVS